MGLLSTLGLKPTPAMLAHAAAGAAAARAAPPKTGSAPPAGGSAPSPEMKDLVARFQDVMVRIKALEARKSPEASALKVATVAAGNLSKGPNGIAVAHRALDKVETQIDDANDRLAEAEAAKKAPADGSAPDAARLAGEARTRLKSLEDRGGKAIAANPRNPNAKWLVEVVGHTEQRIVELEKRGTQREIDDVRAQLDWLEESVVRFEEEARQAAPEAAAKPPPEESPALKKVKAQFRHAMAEIKKLSDAHVPQADALKKAAIDAGNMATSPKGIEKARVSLEKVMSDAARAKADAAVARAEAEKSAADAAKAAAETFDITVGGRKLVGVHRAEAMQALRLEAGRLNAQLESGWAYHVDQMNLPNEVPFQAWLTSGVDAVKSFVKGEDAAKIPDLNIWDPAREMMIEVRKAERKGDIKAIEALLPKIATAIPQARAKVGKYQDQMEGSAQTGVEGGRFVEDTAVSAIGTIVEKRTGNNKLAKAAAQGAARGMFEGVEQFTEWVIGTRDHADFAKIGTKARDEAVWALVKDILAGKFKDLFKSRVGSYIGKAVDDETLKELGLSSREAFMTAAQKYFAEFAAKQGAALIKAAVKTEVNSAWNGHAPASPEALVDAIAAELTKGSAKQLIIDGMKATLMSK